jgi:hypothetical protein
MRRQQEAHGQRAILLTAFYDIAGLDENRGDEEVFGIPKIMLRIPLPTSS